MAKRKGPSSAENKFMLLWRSIKGQPYIFDTFKFHPERRWRFDFAFVEQKVAVEVEGGVFMGKFGGHTSGVGYTKNCEKYNEAALAGWTVFRVTPAQIETKLLTRIKEFIDLTR